MIFYVPKIYPERKQIEIVRLDKYSSPVIPINNYVYMLLDTSEYYVEF